MKKPMPKPQTVSDSYLLYQMGYEVHINDGQVSKVKKSKK